MMRYLPGVVTLALDDSKCAGCGICTEVCPRNVFAIRGGKAVIVDRDACIECGACMTNCPLSAVTVKAGVGCAAALINSGINSSSPVCGCSGGENCC